MKNPPFGRYQLSPWREWFRGLAAADRNNRLRRLVSSLARRAAIAGHPDPFDVEIFAGQRVRLYPRDNLCEKRVFTNDAAWDREERNWIASAIRSAGSHTFRFVDAGANVGLYSVFVHGVAAAAGKSVEIVAIEPDPTNIRRLAFNLEASGAATATQIVDKALGADDRDGYLLFTGDNRGGIQLSTGVHTIGVDSVKVVIAPLAEVLTDAGVTAVDLLKIDIEGGESVVLPAFFANAPHSLYPRAIILETISSTGGEALAACLDAGYKVALQTRMNAVLALDGNGSVRAGSE